MGKQSTTDPLEPSWNTGTAGLREALNETQSGLMDLMLAIVPEEENIASRIIGRFPGGINRLAYIGRRARHARQNAAPVPQEGAKTETPRGKS